MSVPKDECYTNLCVRQSLTVDKLTVRALRISALSVPEIRCENISVSNDLNVIGSSTLGPTSVSSLVIGASASPLNIFEEGTLTLQLTWIDAAPSAMNPPSLVAQYTRINNMVYLTIPDYSGNSGSINDGFVRLDGLGTLTPTTVRSTTINGSENSDPFNGHTIIKTDGTIDIYAGDGILLWTSGVSVIESGTLTYSL